MSSSKVSKELSKRRQHKVIVVFVYVWILTIYPFLVRDSFVYLDCTKQADGSVTLDMDPTVECNFEETTLGGLVFIAIYVGFPAPL